MKKITLKEFKSLISWLSADEMIDMMPKTIKTGKTNVVDKNYEVLEVDSANLFLIVRDNFPWQFALMYANEDDNYISPIICWQSADRWIFLCCTEMLLRLLTNNYLSDYQLITDD